MTHVVCLGDVMVDVVAQVSGPLAFGSDTPATITLHGGGAAANVAAWLVAGGASATFVGRIGDDGLGLRAVAELSGAGVEPLVTVDPTRATGTCIVLVNEHGERTMIPCAGANDVPGDLALLPADADWLYLSGYSIMSPGVRPFALDALQLARTRGWSIAVDAASSAPLHELGGEIFLDWLGEGVLLLANSDEARVLTGLDEPEAAARKLGALCGSAVVKRGELGAVWSDGTQLRSVSAVPAHPVDTTGAGDAFAAGFLAGGPDIEDALVLAAQLGARAVATVGARP